MLRNNWLVTQLNLTSTYTDYATTETLSNYIEGDSLYGMPPLDPASVLAADISQNWIQSGDTPIWAYHVVTKVWCIIGYHDKLAILAQYANNTNKTLSNPSRCQIAHNIQINLSNLSRIDQTAPVMSMSANSVEVFVEKQGLSRPSTPQGCVYVDTTTSGNIFMPSNTCISTILRDPGGSLQTWNMTIGALYNLGNTTNNQSQPVNFTGRIAILAYGKSGLVWTLGRMSQSNILPNQYAAFFNNYNPNNLQNQLPPITIGNYTIALNNYWAYHITQKIWYEVDQDSYLRIQIAGQSTELNYVNTAMPNWTNQNSATIDGTVTSGDIQVFWSGIPTTTVTNTLYNGAPFSQAQYPGSAFVSETLPSGLLVQQGGTFIPFWADQVILEPINTGGTITWMATTVQALQSRVVTRQGVDPIFITGYAAIFQNGTWILGRNSLNGTGLNQVNNFASVITNPAPPPSQVGPHSLQTGLNSTYWAYHMSHMLWYEVDRDSYVRIQSNNVSTTIQTSSIKTIPMLMINKTATLNSDIINNVADIEVFVERVPGTPPAITQVPYPGQTIGTFTNGEPTGKLPPSQPGNIFGQADVLLPAFSQVPTATDGVVVWDYDSNDWRALYKDQIVVETFSQGQSITYNSNTINSIILTGRIAAIDSLSTKLQTSIVRVQKMYAQSQTDNIQSDAAWQATGLTPSRIQEAQVAAQLVTSATQSISTIYQNFQNNFNSIVTLNNAYTNANTKGDLDALYQIYKQLANLQVTSRDLIAQVTNYLAIADQQTSIAVNGAPPTNLFTPVASFFKGIQNQMVNFALNIYTNTLSLLQFEGNRNVSMWQVISSIITNFFVSIWNRIPNFGKSTWQNILNLFIYISNNIVNLVNYLKVKFGR